MDKDYKGSKIDDKGTSQTPEQDVEGHSTDIALNEEKVGGSDSVDPGSGLNESEEGGKYGSGTGLNEEVAGGKDNGQKKLY